jgi:DNA-binding SARP family transcriptional activator
VAGFVTLVITKEKAREADLFSTTAMTPNNCAPHPDPRHAPPALGGLVWRDPDCGGAPPLPEAVAAALRSDQPEVAGAALERWWTGLPEGVERLQGMFLAAHVLLQHGWRPAGLEQLRRALVQSRVSGGCLDLADGLPEGYDDLLARLCAEALEAGIESCPARRIIERAGLRPPSPCLIHWPYPVRIHTLGQATVLLRGQPLRFSGKAQRQPLLLLHCLLAKGGRAVPVTLLRQALGEGDNFGDAPLSRGAFDMALNRLRHLLALPDLLQLGDGLLSLNLDLCWVDAWACEQLLMQVDQQPDPGCGLALLERVLNLYEGDFLAGEDTAWAVLARERIRARLQRVARRLGETFELAGRQAEADTLYERMRELFPLDEELCLRLLRSHLRRNEYGQAVSLHARCRELFTKVLGVLPGPAIEALFEPVRA